MPGPSHGVRLDAELGGGGGIGGHRGIYLAFNEAMIAFIPVTRFSPFLPRMVISPSLVFLWSLDSSAPWFPYNRGQRMLNLGGVVSVYVGRDVLGEVSPIFWRSLRRFY